MRISALSGALLAAGMLIAVPAFAQSPTDAPKTGVQKQRTDGDSPTMVGPGSQASKQKTDGGSLPMVGPGSGAYKQKTDGESLPMVGPGSGAYKKQ
jgi:hypothetical protein